MTRGEPRRRHLGPRRPDCPDALGRPAPGIAIARALLHDPELLIIDEPTLGVDVEARHAIWLHLRVLRARGRTIVVATNYLDEVQALCDSVAVLRAGRLLAVDSPEALVTRTGNCLDVECGEHLAGRSPRRSAALPASRASTRSRAACPSFCTARRCPET